MNILITDVSSYKAIVIAKFLKRTYANIRIVSCDTRPLTKTLHTKYSDSHHVLQASLSEPQRYCEEIATLVKTQNIGLMLPVNSVEMAILLPNRALFGQAMAYWGSDEAFALLNNKAKLADFCLSHGIKHPQRFKDLNNVSFPLVIKPSISSSAKGVYYCRDPQQYQAALSNVEGDQKHLIVQQFVEGIGVGYSVFANKGEIVCGYGHKRLAEYPVTGGSSMYRCGFEHSGMHSIAAKIVAKTNWSGFAMFEFKLDTTGILWLLEVNPRVWGSIYQGLTNGTNYFQTLLAGQVATTRGDHDYYTYLSPYVYLSLIVYLFKGKPKPLFTFLTHLRRNEADISLFADGKGFLSTLTRLL